MVNSSSGGSAAVGLISLAGTSGQPGNSASISEAVTGGGGAGSVSGWLWVNQLSRSFIKLGVAGLSRDGSVSIGPVGTSMTVDCDNSVIQSGVRSNSTGIWLNSDEVWSVNWGDKLSISTGRDRSFNQSGISAVVRSCSGSDSIGGASSFNQSGVSTAGAPTSKGGPARGAVSLNQVGISSSA